MSLSRTPFAARESRAYDYQIRRKAAGEVWRSFCVSHTNDSDNSGRGAVRQGFTDVEPATVYEVRYRYRNSSSCDSGSPDNWSLIGEGRTGEASTGGTGTGGDGTGGDGTGGDGTGDATTYERLDLIQVSPGRVQFSFFSAGGCIHSRQYDRQWCYLLHCQLQVADEGGFSQCVERRFGHRKNGTAMFAQSFGVRPISARR